ncbi:glycoside hydrolase family 19 protein [Roseibium album]|uniref:glycoside hydrolase family 19 protein n=1 Tax=Roseibium album TaxID=311410 RepID=UPI003BAE2ABB
MTDSTNMKARASKHKTGDKVLKNKNYIFDRKRFFEKYRNEFGRIKNSKLVANIETFLSFIEKDRSYNSITEIAYVMATVKHETGHTFKPEREKYNGKKSEYFGEKYGPAVYKNGKKVSGHKDAQRMLHVSKVDGAKYYGRGYVQITWKRNYQDLGRSCNIAGLVEDPDKALEPKNAYCILAQGMQKGQFRPPHKLEDFFGNEKSNYEEARDIVNANGDKKELIAGYARQFEEILKFSFGQPAQNAPNLNDKSHVKTTPAETPAADVVP